MSILRHLDQARMDELRDPGCLLKFRENVALARTQNQKRFNSRGGLLIGQPSSIFSAKYSGS